jgi:hypothetical protein
MCWHRRWLTPVLSASMAATLLASCGGLAKSSSSGSPSGGPSSQPAVTTTLDPFQAERIAQQQATKAGFFQASLPSKFEAEKGETVTATISPISINVTPTSTSGSNSTIASTTPQLPIRISTTMAVVLDAVGATVTAESPTKQSLLLIDTEQTTWRWLVQAAEPPLGQRKYDLHLVFHVSFFVHPDDQSGIEVTPAPVRDVIVTINTRKSISKGLAWVWKAIIALAGLGVFTAVGAWWAKRRKKRAGDDQNEESGDRTKVDLPDRTVEAEPPGHRNGARRARRRKTHRP